MTPQQQNILEWLEHFGDTGTTVFELTQLRCGTEARKHFSVLRREGYPITSVWETRNGRSYKRYKLGKS